jgi:hypothetical protein
MKTPILVGTQILQLHPTLDPTRKVDSAVLGSLGLSITVLKHPPTPSTFHLGGAWKILQAAHSAAPTRYF